MVRVGGGWVDLDSYLREYIGKRESSYRRRSGSVEPLQQQPGSPLLSVELVELEVGARSVSSLGVRNENTGEGSASGRRSALEVRRSVSPFEEKGTRRVFMRRTQGS
jgi:Growth-Arrest-Specific Protein 2 Domain